jgi:hypothetical protein
MRVLARHGVMIGWRTVDRSHSDHLTWLGRSGPGTAWLVQARRGKVWLGVVFIFQFNGVPQMSPAVQSSQSIAELTKALNRFHQVCPKIPKSCKNPFLKSKYADLSTILDIVQPVLNECELVVQQHPTSDYGLTTIVSHTSGEWMSSEYKMQPLESVVEKGNAATGGVAIKAITPQSIGSVITYQRRYALGAILALNIDDDNDGNPPEMMSPVNQAPKKTAAELMAEAAAKATASQPGVEQVAVQAAPATSTATAQPSAPTPGSELESTKGQRELIEKLFDQLNASPEDRLRIIKKRGVQTLRSFNFAQAGELIAALERKLKEMTATTSNLVDTSGAASDAGVHAVNGKNPGTATIEQVAQIKSELDQWEQAQLGVVADFIARLQSSGVAKIADLSFADASDLLGAIQMKNIAGFFERELAGASA